MKMKLMTINRLLGEAVSNNVTIWINMIVIYGYPLTAVNLK